LLLTFGCVCTLPTENKKAFRFYKSLHPLMVVVAYRIIKNKLQEIAMSQNLLKTMMVV